MTDQQTPAPTNPPAQPSESAPAGPAASAGQGKPAIGYDDFAKLDLRVGKVLAIEDHPNADKLYVVTVDLGGRQRQIIAGLRPYMPQEALLGKNIIVVANMEPRKMRGLESQGMLLAAGFEEAVPDAAEGAPAARKVVILTTDGPVPPGAAIS